MALPLLETVKCSRIRQEYVSFCSFAVKNFNVRFVYFVSSVFVQLLICCSVCVNVSKMTIKQFVGEVIWYIDSPNVGCTN